MKKDNTEKNYLEYISELIRTDFEYNAVFVELGTRSGKSSQFLKKSWPYLRITTYDNVYSESVAKASKENDIKYIIANTRNVRHKHKKIDILFCDTMHTAAQLVAEYNNFRNALHEKSIIIVDDVFLNDKAHGFMSIPGQKIVLGYPTRPSGLGIIRFNKDWSEWSKSHLVVAESIPPSISKMYEKYVRLMEKIRRE